MKSFKGFINETVERRNAPDENRFIDKHVIDKKDHPAAKEDQFTAKAKKAKRGADHEAGQDKEVYEETELEEGVIDDLRKIVKTKSASSVKFKNGSKTKVDMFTASAMVKIHDALNGANQKKFADAIDKDESMFMKMMDFAMSKAK
jgi:hypothetical protein